MAELTPEMISKLTPAMRQYLDIKLQYNDCILFFRLGDFYEMFFDDALTASKDMDVALTGKNCGLDERAPMCGVPYHAADTYIAKLIEKGHKVAICEQMEDPALAKGIVKREVIRIVTPGTVTSSNMLDEHENNYIASVFLSKERTGMSYCDISTGEVCIVKFPQKKNNSILLNELTNINAREILINESASYTHEYDEISELSNAYISVLDDENFDREKSMKIVAEQFESFETDKSFEDDNNASIDALGALLQYLAKTQRHSMSHIKNLKISDVTGRMSIDRATLKNLELTESLFEKKAKGSLLGVLDKTMTAMGSRKLKSLIRQPMNNLEEIKSRLDAVRTLFDDIILRNDIKTALKGINDLERLSGRVSCGNANARDLISLKNSLSFLPELKALISGTDNSLLTQISHSVDSMPELYEKIKNAIVDEPPFAIKDGGIFRNGYSEELDNLKASIKDGQEWIAGLESKERERTGIKTLKVGFNKVFGYYIDITKSNIDMVPDNYIRKQTLVNNERYITAELKEIESIVLNAEAKINSLEYELFSELRNYVEGFTSSIQLTSEAIAETDVITSFAEVSSMNNYVMPEVNESEVISIHNGRHPVIEQTINDGLFVSNDTYINQTDTSLLLITGPNMAGKSTYMRQTAIIVLMAQIGCFVPADKADIGITDRIFTRIGASDNLSQGQSTFFVEMNELAYILNNATSKSLIILDEIGRGTSTYDGLSIAWAVADYLCKPDKRIRTLFATHYHELTSLENKMTGLKNLNVGVSEDNGDIVFLHKIVEGSASRSYGIHVAKLAGIPVSLLEVAQTKLDELENDKNTDFIAESVVEKSEKNKSKTKNKDKEFVQLSLFDFVPNPIIEKLKKLDIMNITPSQAFTILEELKDAAEKNN